MSTYATGQREVAKRVFAPEFNDATYTFQESDEDRAPVYALLPTGAAANRVFIVGTLTESEDLGNDTEYWRGRVVDPVGTFFVYAGQYQPQAAKLLSEIEPPAYAAVTGKPRTFEPDSGTINVSLQPEAIAIVDAATRARWVDETAARTLNRIEHFDAPDNTYAAMAREQYDGPVESYREEAIMALEALLDERRANDA